VVARVIATSPVEGAVMLLPVELSLDSSLAARPPALP
jgi:hypothetical protein